jgi:hypothetical protein
VLHVCCSALLPRLQPPGHARCQIDRFPGSVKQYEGKLAALGAINDALRQENEQLRADLEDAALPRGDAGAGAGRTACAAAFREAPPHAAGMHKPHAAA